MSIHFINSLKVSCNFIKPGGNDKNDDKYRVRLYYFRHS